MANDIGPIHIKRVVIEYRYGDDWFRLTIPETAQVDAVLFDRRVAGLLRGVQMEDRSIQEEFIRASGYEGDLEGWSPPGVVESVTPIRPDGTNWKRLPDEFGETVESLERIPVIWSVEHSMTDLCIHHRDCMLFCMQD